MPNTITNLLPVVFAQGLQTLREFCVMPRLVNNNFADAPAGQGDTINWPLPTALSDADVAPGPTQVTPPDLTPLRASVTLNRWRRAGFYMTDKERSEIGSGFQSMQLQEAVKALANGINAHIFGQYVRVARTVGAPGTAVVAGADYTARSAVIRSAMRALDDAAVPGSDRRMVLHTSTYQDALGVPEFVRVNEAGREAALRAGLLGELFGFDTYKDQQVPTHGATVATAGAITVNGNQAAGLTSISINKATNATNLIAGDVLTIGTGAAAIQVAVAAPVTLAVGNTSVSLQFPLQRAITAGEAITLTAGAAAYRVNLGFHRDAFAFASRRLTSEVASATMMSMADPVSGVVLRMELIRQNKQDYIEFDVLYGSACIRPELAVRVVE